MFYNQDQFIGKEHFARREKAEESIYESPYASQSDYYEIIDNSTGKIIQEFMIAPPLYTAGEEPLEDSFHEEEWFIWSTEDL